MNYRAGFAVSLPLALALAAAPEAKATPSLCDSIAGNLVQNCGFETTGGWNETITNWFTPHSGNSEGSIVPTGGGTGSTYYSQTITGLVDGETYNFSAWINGELGTTMYFRAFVDGTKIFDGVTDADWTEITSSFTAAGTSMLLYFYQVGLYIQGSPYYSNYGSIDDVSIVAASTPVPEPASAALLGLGLAGLAGLRRRR
jgi:PEP-CTERM motif/Carbohydrate binding domain